MKPLVYLRPLTLADAWISYKWRNDSDIWMYTEFKPDRYISPELEAAWLGSKLTKTNEKRFAICLQKNDQYIGNVQLLDIDSEKAWFHIFIGEKHFWGQGISQKATKLILSYAFSDLALKNVLLEVNPLNIAAIKVYEKIGFTALGTNDKSGFTKMGLSNVTFNKAVNL